MADAAETTRVPDWEAKFHADFDRICAVFWSQIASHAEQPQPQPQPLTTPGNQHQSTTLATKHSSKPETQRVQCPSEPAQPAAQLDSAASPAIGKLGTGGTLGPRF
ncbi:Hypothetical predicted protein [Pelobates cultripes]|uniref:Uncharacterized protein n=1 Tax=Pelobates cultripes TaxID=61616 RepID=A0AAD1VXL0_PELCU|nr:Hypothetical predicted protein [Pelobates cultripes]